MVDFLSNNAPSLMLALLLAIVSFALILKSERLKRANYVIRELTLQLQFQGVIAKVVEKPNDVVFTVDFTDPDAKLRAEKAADKYMHDRWMAKLRAESGANQYMHDRWMAKGRALMSDMKTHIEGKIGPFTDDEMNMSQEELDRILALEADYWPTGDESGISQEQRIQIIRDALRSQEETDAILADEAENWPTGDEVGHRRHNPDQPR